LGTGCGSSGTPRVIGPAQRLIGGQFQPRDIAPSPEGIVDVVDIVVLVIEGITLCLLLFLLYLMRNVYVLVRRDSLPQRDSNEGGE